MIPRLGISLAVTKQVNLQDVVSLALLAEEWGYDSVWVPETWGADAGTVLAILAARTRRIRLASGVFNVYSRSAALLAQMAATIQHASDGRFLMGLGVSGPKVIEDWHGVAYGEPLKRTKDYVAALRLALSGKTLDMDGAYVRVHDFRLENPPRSAVPLYLAAIGPRNAKLAGEIFDGWLPIFAPLPWFKSRLALLRDGAEGASRTASAVDVAAFLPCLIGDTAPELLRQHIAYYVGRMGSFYAHMLRESGFDAEVTAIRAASLRGDHRSAVRLVGDGLLDACTLGYHVETVQRRVTAYRDSGMRLPILIFPHSATVQKIAHSIEALAPANASAGGPSPIIST